MINDDVIGPDTTKIKKRKAASDYDTDEISAGQRSSIKDLYGCVNWEPKNLPLPETVESQQEKKN